MADVKRLKEVLIGHLIKEITEGVTAVDRETGEIVKLSPPPSLLGVAAKVVKDFSEEAADTIVKGAAELSAAVERYRKNHPEARTNRPN